MSHDLKEKEKLTTSKLPGATIRLSITLLIFVTRDKMEDYRMRESLCHMDSEIQIADWSLCGRCVWGRTCSAGVGLRSWFLFSRHSLKAVSSGTGFTRGNAISHWRNTTVRTSSAGTIRQKQHLNMCSETASVTLIQPSTCVLWWKRLVISYLRQHRFTLFLFVLVPFVYFTSWGGYSVPFQHAQFQNLPRLISVWLINVCNIIMLPHQNTKIDSLLTT